MAYAHLSNFIFFFFNDTATTEIYTLSLHDALPICRQLLARQDRPGSPPDRVGRRRARRRHFRKVSQNGPGGDRSEEHTSELQSQSNLVCRLLLEKKKNINPIDTSIIQFASSVFSCD